MLECSFASCQSHTQTTTGKQPSENSERGPVSVCSSRMAYTCLQSPCSTSYAPALSSIHNFGSGCLTSGRKDVLGRWRRLQKVSTGRSASCRHSVNTIAGIKLIENYDGKFELARDSEDALKRLLDSPTFAKQVYPKQMQHIKTHPDWGPFGDLYWILERPG